MFGAPFPWHARECLPFSAIPAVLYSFRLGNDGHGLPPFLDDGGRITGVHDLDCANDEEATEKAAQLLDGHDLEVWHRERRVARMKHHTRQ